MSPLLFKFPTVFPLALLQIPAILGSWHDPHGLTDVHASPGMGASVWSFKIQYSTQRNGCSLWEVRRAVVWAR